MDGHWLVIARGVDIECLFLLVLTVPLDCTFRAGYLGIFSSRWDSESRKFGTFPEDDEYKQ